MQKSDLLVLLIVNLLSLFTLKSSWENLIVYAPVLIFSILYLKNKTSKTFLIISLNFLLIGAFISEQVLFLVPYLLLLYFIRKIDFNYNDLLRVGVVSLAFWISFIYFDYTPFKILFAVITAGILYFLNINLDIIKSKTFVITFFFCLLVLILNPIPITFANYAIIASFLLFAIFYAKNSIFLYQALAFSLVGAFLSIENSLLYTLIFLIFYLFLLKSSKEIEFNINKTIQTTFSCLAFWIIFIEFYKDYLVFAIALSAGIFAYLLYDVLEENLLNK